MGVNVLNFNLRNKIAGAVYGFAIGDAMGATTEFLTKEQIKNRYGQVNEIIGGGWLRLNPGEITDDTQMTLCVIDAIMTRPNNVEEFRTICEDNFISWLNSEPKDIGNQCRIALCDLRDFNERASVNKNALGNGSLMRAMPLAILNLQYHNITQGIITHNNSICSKVIISYSELLQNYLYGNTNSNYRGKVEKLLNPSGHVINTYNNSVYWSNQNSFEDAIIGAVNDGGDADTIAAITGSLAGAKFGLSNIPEKWIKQLCPDVKILLENFINFVYNCLQI